MKTKEAEILRSLCVLTKRDDGFSSRFHRLVIRRKVVRPGREYGSEGNLGWTDGVGSTHRGQGFHQIVASSSGFLLFFVSHLKNQHWCEWLQTDTMCKHSFTGSRLPSEIPSQDCVRAELSSHDCVSAAHKRFHTYNLWLCAHSLNLLRTQDIVSHPFIPSAEQTPSLARKVMQDSDFAAPSHPLSPPSDQ